MLTSVRTVGVEEELMLFATATGAPRPAAEGERLANDRSTEVAHEFKLEQAEIASAPTSEVGELVADLYRRRCEIIAAAGERDARVAAIGTSPLDIAATPTPDERYARMHEHFALVAGDQLTCGMHVHVSVESRAEGVAAIDAIRAWLPVLLAVSANSPFWGGRDSGYASYRSVSWGRWPTAGPTQPFGDEAGYDVAVAELIASGAALDSGMIYFDARLSASYPTVEIRVADVVQRVADSGLVAALARALVEQGLRGLPGAAVGAGLVRAAMWRAARFGLSGGLLDPIDGRVRPAFDVLGRVLEVLEPALRTAGDTDVVASGVGRLRDEGTGAELQRSDLARRGSLADLVDGAVSRTAARP
jgi:carboxylate-amine ligase